MSFKTIHDVLKELPSDATVLDIGGASGPYKRATHLIDYVPFTDVQYIQAKGEGEIRFNADSYTQWDICARKPFPYADKQFDFSICSHVLEDIRDPLWVCSEIMRTAKSGYIEVPSRIYELTFGIEARSLAGASHHRWLCEEKEGKLSFTFKNIYVHDPRINNKNPVLTEENKVIRFFWTDSFEYYENWLSSGGDMFAYLQGRSLSQKEVRKFFRIISPKNIIHRWVGYLYNTNNFIKTYIDKMGLR